MAVLGQTERLIYSAKGLKSGLTDVDVYVLKPNGNTVGPFRMTEFVHVSFKGAYFFDFVTNQDNDDFGTYSWVAVSPTESHRDFNKIVYEEISVAELTEIVGEVSEVLRALNQVEAEIEVFEEVEIEIFVEE